ncbi:MAG: DUF2807 domain-containing protein [Anaerolineae bacterium]|nr:DUF2807 domain-containing protein [Anaerolineae bacterium]
MKWSIIPIALSMAMLLSGCCALLSVVRGSGRIITETRQVSGFERIALSGSGEVILTQGALTGVRVTADENLLPYIRTEVQGDTLVLGLDSRRRLTSIRPTRKIRYHVTYDTLRGLTASGSGSIGAETLAARQLELTVSGSGGIRIDTLRAEELEVGISGSGNVDLAGRTTAQRVQVSGSGNYRARELESETADVRVSGSGRTTISVSEQLSARISGSGSVEYYGQPRVRQDISGSGRVIARGER